MKIGSSSVVSQIGIETSAICITWKSPIDLALSLSFLTSTQCYSRKQQIDVVRRAVDACDAL